jgi:hypothetical protein
MATDELTKLASTVERQAALDAACSSTRRRCLRSGCLGSRRPRTSPLSCMSPCLCKVAQGAKQVFLADKTYRLDPAQSRSQLSANPWKGLV